MNNRLRTTGLSMLMGLLISLPVHAVTATRSSSFVYDPASGLLTKEIIEPGNSALCLVTEYTYDAYGNKKSVTTRNCNGSAGEAAAPAVGTDAVIAPRTTSSTYDVRGQFAVSTTNALGHTETRSFDERFGAVDGLIGPNGLPTTWAYDGFGRKTTETRADGTQTLWSYLNVCDLPNPNITGERYCIASISTGQGRWARTYYDILNRQLAVTHIDFDNTEWVDEKRVTYNALGQAVQSYMPYAWSGVAAAKFATVSYDLLGRPVQEGSPVSKDGTRTTKHVYNGLTKTDTTWTGATTLPGQDRITVSNVLGQTVSVTDDKGSVIGYTYDAFGNLIKTTDAAGNITVLTYDARGRKIGMDDPDMGIWSYAYNALGELIRQVDAKKQTVTMTYDKLGRMLARNEPDLTSTWVYDTAANGIGKLTSASTDNKYKRTHVYDALGRLSSTSTVIDNVAKPYVTSTTYDGVGRPSVQTYPTGYAVKNIYNAVGTLVQVVNNTIPAKVLWTLNNMDAQGHLLQQTYGNGLVTQQVYDAGMLTRQLAGVGNAVQNSSYTYDNLGNLLTRSDISTGLTETYLYDTLNRVTSATATSGAVNTVSNFTYNALGNITSKTGTGTYSYNPSGLTSIRPHAVSSIAGTVNGVANPTFLYDANGNMTAGASRAFTWTSFNMPSTIKSCFGSVVANCNTTSFLYNSEHERTIENQADGSQVVTLSPRYDTGLHFEKKSNFSIKDPKTGVLIPAIEYEHYLYAGGQMFGKYITTTTLAGGPVLASDGTVLAPPTYEYYTKDHLGSIVAITGPAGGVMQRLSYDVWGKRRSPNGAADPNGLLNKSDMYHGYTGHEMLDDVGLIHMNGRLYDPMMARFVSADFLIPDAGDLQSYNRYSYVVNNPLAYTDASGQCPWCFVAIVAAEIGYQTGVIDNGTARMIQSIAVMAWMGPAGSLGGAMGQGFVGGVIASNGSIEAGMQGAATAGLFYGAGSFADAMGQQAANAGQSSAAWAHGGIGRVMAHAAAGCAGAMASGGNCGRGAMSAGFAEWAGPKLDSWGKLDPMVSRAVVGGTVSVIGGGKFANGAVMAAYGYLFNCSSHPETCPEAQKNDKERYYTVESRSTGKLIELPVGDPQERFSINPRVNIPVINVQLPIEIQFATQDYGQFEVYDYVRVERWSFTGQPTGRELPWGSTPPLVPKNNISSVEKMIRLCSGDHCATPAWRWK